MSREVLSTSFESFDFNFQDLNNKSDFVVNGVDEDRIMSSNFHMILSCLFRLFSW